MCVYVCVLPDAPRITHAPRDQKVIDNGVATFVCLASGNPAPDVYFRRSDGRRLTTRHGGNSRYSVVAVPHGAVLRINSLSARRDDGLVECIAENSLGDPATASATLHVYDQGLGRCARALRSVCLSACCI